MGVADFIDNLFKDRGARLWLVWLADPPVAEEYRYIMGSILQFFSLFFQNYGFHVSYDHGDSADSVSLGGAGNRDLEVAMGAPQSSEDGALEVGHSRLAVRSMMLP